MCDVGAAVIATAQLVRVLRRTVEGGPSRTAHGFCAALDGLGACAFGIAYRQVRGHRRDTPGSVRKKLAFAWRVAAVGVFALLRAVVRVVLLVTTVEHGGFPRRAGGVARYALSFALLLPGPVIGLVFSDVDALACTFLYGAGVGTFSEALRADGALALVGAWMTAWYAYPRTWTIFAGAPRVTRSELVTSACVLTCALAAEVDSFACTAAVLCVSGTYAVLA